MKNRVKVKNFLLEKTEDQRTCFFFGFIYFLFVWFFLFFCFFFGENLFIPYDKASWPVSKRKKENEQSGEHGMSVEVSCSGSAPESDPGSNWNLDTKLQYFQQNVSIRMNIACVVTRE